MLEDKESIEYRLKLFKEGPSYRWPSSEHGEEKLKSNRGRKAAPSKKILNTKPDHYKWWRE